MDGKCERTLDELDQLQIGYTPLKQKKFQAIL